MKSFGAALWRMWLPPVVLAGVVLVLALTAAAPGCAKKPDSGKVRVAASIFPLADVVRQIGGQHVQVDCMLPTGRSPHGYELTADNVAALHEARLLVLVGMDLESWGANGKQIAARRKATVLEVGPLAAGHVEADSDGHAHAAHNGHDHDAAHDDHADADAHVHHHQGDPHVWVDPVRMQAIATAVADALIGVDPAHKADYLANRDKFFAQLRQLDAQYRTGLAGVKHKQLVTFHETFNYLCDRYGLEHAALAPPGGSGDNSDRLAKVEAFIRKNNVKVIFLEPEFSPEKFATVQSRTGVRTARLDPLGGEGLAGHDSYLAMMRTNLQTLTRELDR